MAKSTDKSKDTAAKKTVKKEVKATKPKAAPKPKAAAKTKKQAKEEALEVTVEQKLMSLYNLQQIDSHVDKIRIVRGELPIEVEDLEDEIAGLDTRINNYIQEIEDLENNIGEKKNAIKESSTLIKKYEEQQMNVRNNREYDSLTKEVEYQGLEIQLAEKRIKEFQAGLVLKNQMTDEARKELTERKVDLDVKKSELDDIVKETDNEEKNLINSSEKQKEVIEERLLTAYQRIRKNARNGLAVVQIERDACGGCFNKIPPQHQLEIRMHKKIIVCEYCGRILVDDAIAKAVSGE